MQLKHLEYLQLVVEKGNFAAAAKSAGVTQPAITQAMQKLEREWGVALFEKSGRQKLPTQAALKAAQRAADLKDRIQGLAQARSSGAAWVLGRDAAILRVGMAPAAALLYGPAIERAWRAYAPDGLLQIVSEGSALELLAALRRNGLDLAAAPRPRGFPLAGLKRLPLHTSTPTVFARKGHPLGGAQSLRDIGEAGWAVAGRAGTAGSVIEEAHRVRRLQAPQILAQCPDYASLLNLVAHSDLLCVVPHPALLPATHKAILQPISVHEGLPQYEVSLFWAPTLAARHGAALNAIIAALRDGNAPAERR